MIIKSPANTKITKKKSILSIPTRAKHPLLYVCNNYCKTVCFTLSEYGKTVVDHDTYGLL